MSVSADLPSLALQLLRKLDIRVVAGGPVDWQLVLPDGGTYSVHVKIRRQPPPPSWVDAHSQDRGDGSLLIVTARLTHYLRALAQLGSIDVIDVQENLAIIAGSTYALPQMDDRATRSKAAARGRKPWVRWATERLLLLADEPMTQVDIAAALAVTQQSVSNALRQHRYARRATGGWSIENKREQLQEHLLEYSGPGGASTYWLELEPPVPQAERANTFSAEMGVPALHTGDVAADVYAPWRLPRTAAVYTSEILDFTPAGFTPASVEDYTLRITTPEDETIWRTAAVIATHRTQLGLVDPVVTLVDVLRSPGPDVVDAAARLQEAILDGTWRGFGDSQVLNTLNATVPRPRIGRGTVDRALRKRPIQS